MKELLEAIEALPYQMFHVWVKKLDQEQSRRYYGPDEKYPYHVCVNPLHACSRGLHDEMPYCKGHGETLDEAADQALRELQDWLNPEGGL